MALVLAILHEEMAAKPTRPDYLPQNGVKIYASATLRPFFNTFASSGSSPDGFRASRARDNPP